MTAPAGRMERILLVDDNEADNVFHEFVIRRAGFTGELTVCESGPSALAHLSSAGTQRPTLILLDINMPGMSGFEFARAAAPLLADEPTAIVVMLTSSGAQDDLERARQMPEITSYLIKPLTAETIADLLAGRY